MAHLVAAFASSHSVMLTCELKDWQRHFREFDPKGSYSGILHMACRYEAKTAPTAGFWQAWADAACLRPPCGRPAGVPSVKIPECPVIETHLSRRFQSDARHPIGLCS